MKSLFRFITLLLLVSSYFCTQAQTAIDTNTMYLVKGDRVVGKYNVNDVDYVCFNLPDSVIDASIWLTIGKVGKNHLSYSVKTDISTRTYAHGIVSYYEANYLALDAFGQSITELGEDTVVQILQACLPYVGYLGIGSNSFEMKDWADDGLNGKFSVRPGTKYYVCVWEVDPTTQKPLETFLFAEATTLDPAQSNATLSVSFKRQNQEGLAFDIQGDEDILYVTTCFGSKSRMEEYISAFGLDFLIGTFGQTFTIPFLQGSNEIDDNIEAATWPISDAGEYVLYIRGYDANGNIVDAQCTATATEVESEGPEIKILSRSKDVGKVSVNFEILPSNVSEAYVRLLGENDLDDLINEGRTIHEVATGGQATDIVDAINSVGEYTFTNNSLEEKWYSLLIYAKDKDGARTTLRMDFWPDTESQWGDRNPEHKAVHKFLTKRMLSKSRKPTFERVK